MVAFASETETPLTNNQSERNLCPSKVKGRKTPNMTNPTLTKYSLGKLTGSVIFGATLIETGAL
uniref:Transposase n=1 Tax=Candidatus Kentrum sp. TUN TaxID=2126343 RepID=A0A451A0B6_9GAMM|nr:MAG: hypothetical protein BECKTUN1418F_GA0071002_11765 [Candidatus Kentron sp. TUN]VFK67999.1 MAG: hypothetical protein BECKTUN1418E_GA0071001_11735 [Candidatus Kentron sp. TUN]